jgi:hypothetical protein
MKLSNRNLLAGLIVAMASFSGAAQATTLFSESFEGNLSDWTSMSKTAEIVAAPGGGKALAFVGTYGGGDLVSKAELSSTTGKYTVSFDLEGNCGHTSQCGFFFGVGRFPVPQAGWLLADTSFDINKVFPVSKGGWERVSLTFAAGDNIQLDLEDWNGSAHAGPKSFYIRDLQVTNDPNHLAAGALTVTGVPEPSSWALMLAGFAAIGAMASRRNKTGKALNLA